MVGHRRLHNNGTGTIIESVVGGVLKANRQSHLCLLPHLLRPGPSFGVSDVHHTDVLKAAEHYGGFERYLGPKFLDKRICYVKNVVDNLMIIYSGSIIIWCRSYRTS